MIAQVETPIEVRADSELSRIQTYERDLV